MAGASSPPISAGAPATRGLPGGPSSWATRGWTGSPRPPPACRSSPTAPTAPRSPGGGSAPSRTWTSSGTCPRGWPRAAMVAEVALFDPPVSGPPARGAPRPLADRMRPRTLDEVVGQEHLLGPQRVLRVAPESGEMHSMILWGPPGSGKTTLASLMAHVPGPRFVAFSAVLSGVKEIREVIAEAARDRARRGARTILFVDEIHRFNRAQQDAFLPHVEKGTLVLVGA